MADAIEGGNDDSDLGRLGNAWPSSFSLHSCLTLLRGPAGLTQFYLPAEQIETRPVVPGWAKSRTYRMGEAEAQCGRRATQKIPVTARSCDEIPLNSLDMRAR